MSTTAVENTGNAALDAAKTSGPSDESILALVDSLRETFAVEFTIFLGEDGSLLHESEEQPSGDAGFRGELARAVAMRREPAFIGEEEPILLLALPLSLDEQAVVAVGTFVSRAVSEDEDLSEAANLLGFNAQRARNWIEQQEVWCGRQLNAVGRTFQHMHRAEQSVNRYRSEIDSVSANLACTYEEISVLYGVTQHLQLSSTDEELGRLALDWLGGVIPAEGLAIQYLPTKYSEDIAHKARRASVLLTSEDCPVDQPLFNELIGHLDLEDATAPIVINRDVTGEASWQFGDIEQLIVIPLSQGKNTFGWLAAFNHLEGDDFGTVEASLMKSVAAVLGIHSGNIDLYRKQSDFLSQMVRALTSAIDAKDPYTCGHSDRVARIGVRLGQHLGCNVKELNRLYMGGLLHDIGKIGIDDHVLRKPGRLSPAEFEHIKLHPELGYNILRDVKQLEEVLPLILHHHEAWDGSGYPYGLVEDETPLLARICAVADAFDAMSSDRPYRQGMADDRVDSVFREGSGTQWDPQVVEAFFAVRDDIRAICREQRANLSLDVEQWL